MSEPFVGEIRLFGFGTVPRDGHDAMGKYCKLIQTKRCIQF